MAAPKHEFQLPHFNSNIFCAVDTETTGLDPEFHEILEIAIQPIDHNYQISKEVAPLHLFIKPERSTKDAHLSKGIVKQIELYGIPYDKAVDVFLDWVLGLNLKDGKSIVPLAHNWLFDAAFLEQFLGSATFKKYFHGHYRDTMSLACAINDSAGRKILTCPFGRVGLTQLASAMGIPVEPDLVHTAMYDAHLTIDVYRAMVQKLNF